MALLGINFFFTLYCRITHTLLLNQSVARPKTLDISTQTSRAIRFPASYPGFSFDDFSYIVAVVQERIWFKKPREENSIKSDVEMLRVSRLEADLFRSNVRVILQYGVKFNISAAVVHHGGLLMVLFLTRYKESASIFHTLREVQRETTECLLILTRNDLSC